MSLFQDTCGFRIVGGDVFLRYDDCWNRDSAARIGCRFTDVGGSFALLLDYSGQIRTSKLTYAKDVARLKLGLEY
jgi:hypothetical protein